MDGGYYGMQTFDQALYTHVVAGRVSVEDALVAASSPHDFKLLLDAEGRRGTTMADVPTAGGVVPGGDGALSLVQTANS